MHPRGVNLARRRGRQFPFAAAMGLAGLLDPRNRRDRRAGFTGSGGADRSLGRDYGLFSPYAVASFGLDPDAADHMLLPPTLIARVDPLIVLPPAEESGIR